MAEKFLNLKELSEYLHIGEREIRALVNERVIPAYRIGGSFLRFRKEQIDAIRDEIQRRMPYISPMYKIKVDVGKKIASIESTESISDKLIDFAYYYDFYIVSALIIAFLLFLICKM